MIDAPQQPESTTAPESLEDTVKRMVARELAEAARMRREHFGARAIGLLTSLLDMGKLPKDWSREAAREIVDGWNVDFCHELRRHR